ncbi:MAG: hypothetical protein JSR73_13465 [Proteobacteria bacterium]|nr:hypothetical protein [Pseudomonadota bacterium]
MRALLLIAALLPAGAWADGPATAGEPPQPAVIAPLAVHSLLLDVRALPGGGLVTAGERGHVLLSGDGGASWRQSPVPVRSTLTALYFTDARHGWAVGHDETILRTVDGGASWQLVHYAPEREQPLLSVWFDGAGHGLAVGAYSTVYRSDDGGLTWQNVPFTPRPKPSSARKAKPAPQFGPDDMRADVSAEQPHLTAVVADAAGHLYVTAEAGHLYRSDDGGRSWSELDSPYEGSFFGALPLEGESLLVFGLRGHLYRSDDGGRHFVRLEVATEALLAGAARLADGRIVIAGLEGTVLTSGDGGHHFAVRQQADRKGFDAVAPAGDGAVLCGEDGVRRIDVAAREAGS